MTLLLMLGCVFLAGCLAENARETLVMEPPQPQIEQEIAHEFVEMLPGIRVDLEHGVIEFDAVVAVDCHDPETPTVYLEVICCTPDTREHEALVVTTVPPSFVHAALLAVGGSPGRPGAWRQEGKAIIAVPPTGDRVRVTFLTTEADGSTRAHDPAEWIIQKETGRTLREVLPETGWVFAGSRLREFRGREVYDADGTGQLIGLHTFGSEMIGWQQIESPEAGIDEPQWLANAARVPRIGRPIVVRLEVVRVSKTRALETLVFLGRADVAGWMSRGARSLFTRDPSSDDVVGFEDFGGKVSGTELVGLVKAAGGVER